MNGMYEELLEKLRKNNRMSGWTHIDRLIDEAAEAIETLQQENEQLQAQAARMWEALGKAREAIKAAWGDGSANAAMDKASEALTTIDKVIGGKEDV